MIPQHDIWDVYTHHRLNFYKHAVVSVIIFNDQMPDQWAVAINYN